MNKVISKDHFKKLMEKFTGEPVWLDIHTKTVVQSTYYLEFKFLTFENGQYQFGHKKYNEENQYQNILIKEGNVVKIYQDTFAPTVGAEQITLILDDETELIIEYTMH